MRSLLGGLQLQVPGRLVRSLGRAIVGWWALSVVVDGCGDMKLPLGIVVRDSS
jgi:hypothetical protein